MDSLVLGGLIKRLYSSFTMDSFENRVKLQKFFFLLRSYNLDFGYSFSLYIRGPYSPELSRDAFQIQNWNEIKEVKFESNDLESTFLKCIADLEGHKDDIIWLEIATTLLLIKELYPDIADTKDRINKFRLFKPHFKEENINPVYTNLKTLELI